MTDQQVISATRAWLKSFIIAYNICPFASREHQRNSIRYRVARPENLENAVQILIEECVYLDANPETETTLLIFPEMFDDFEDYLDMVAIADRLLIVQNYEGIYQLASFHPDYRFETEVEDQEDPAHYTNRSPYPMLHIIREDSIERALENYPDSDNIPARNIKLTRELGLKKLQSLLAATYSK
ncbi:DUF1415 domain-containing protein [Methylomonas sp. MgM2]